MKKIKEQKGITLVALVVTIVVLLILAGVTITYVFSDNGILSRAQDAASGTDSATVLEEIQQRLLTIQLGNTGTWTYTNDDVQTVVAEVTGKTKDEITVGLERVTTENGNEVDISSLWLDETSSATLVSQITSANYGDYVEYSIDLNDDDDYTNDWKIFYSDGTQVFIIASDYLENSLLPSSTGMSKYSTYGAYWDGTKYNSYSSFGDSSILSLFGFKYGSSSGYGYESGYYSHYATALLLDANNWSDFVDSDYAGYAIGGPTIEMWIESWNAKGYTELYVEDDDYGYGYKIYSTDELVMQDSFYVDVTHEYADDYEAETAGYNDTLYFPHKWGVDECWGYCLSAPAAVGKDFVFHVCCEEGLGWFRNDEEFGVRPLVCLDSEVLGTSSVDGDATTWSLSSGS